MMFFLVFGKTGKLYLEEAKWLRVVARLEVVVRLTRLDGVVQETVKHAGLSPSLPSFYGR